MGCHKYLGMLTQRFGDNGVGLLSSFHSQLPKLLDEFRSRQQLEIFDEVKITEPHLGTQRIAILGVVPTFMADQCCFLIELNHSGFMEPAKIAVKPLRDGPCIDPP